MVRDSDALKIRKWAANGDVQTPEDRGLNRAVGWPADYSQPGGRTPSREVFNQIIRELSSLGVELNTRGLLSWDSSVSYVHPAMVMGGDAKPYVSVADSTGIDPTTDTTESSWSLFEAQGPPGEAGPPGTDANVPLASTSEAGKVELATGDETLNRTDAGKAVTPGALADSVLTAEPTDATEDDKLLTWGVAKAAFLDADTTLSVSTVASSYFQGNTYNSGYATAYSASLSSSKVYFVFISFGAAIPSGPANGRVLIGNTPQVVDYRTSATVAAATFDEYTATPPRGWMVGLITGGGTLTIQVKVLGEGFWRARIYYRLFSIAI